jgi:hypothetical protein
MSPLPTARTQARHATPRTTMRFQSSENTMEAPAASVLPPLLVPLPLLLLLLAALHSRCRATARFVDCGGGVLCGDQGGDAAVLRVAGIGARRE